MTKATYQTGIEIPFTEAFTDTTTPVERGICSALSIAMAGLMSQKAAMASKHGVPLARDEIFNSVLLYEVIVMFATSAHAQGLDFCAAEFAALAKRLAEQFAAEHLDAMRDDAVLQGVSFT